MRQPILLVTFLALALAGCAGGATSVPTNRNAQLPAPHGAVAKPSHAHVINPPLLAANLNVPASSLLSQAGINQISGGFAARFGAIVINSNLTTYGRFLASVHRNYRSGYVDNDRQVWVVTYGFPSGFTTRAGVIAAGGQGIFAYDAVSGTPIARTYAGTYSSLFIRRARPALPLGFRRS